MRSNHQQGRTSGEGGEVMTREEAIKRISELSCAYNHIRMTDCPHCAKEVEEMVKILTQVKAKEGSDG